MPSDRKIAGHDRDAILARIELLEEVAHGRAIAIDMGDTEEGRLRARIAALEGAEGLRGLLASASNLVGVVRNKQWERAESKADSLDFAVRRARALLTTEKTDG